MMKNVLLVLLFVGLVSTNEHWFIFDQNQFPGFHTPLVTLTSPGEKTLSFSLSTYERAIMVDINNETVKLNIERADLLYNTINQIIFFVIRDQTTIETYVNCKLIDSYMFYSSLSMNQSAVYKIDKLSENIQYYEVTPEGQLTQQEIFDTFSCKQVDTSSSTLTNSPIPTIGRPLIRKMQNVIEKVQRRKIRPRRQNNQQETSSTSSLTLVYKPIVDNTTVPNIIFNIPQLNFHIHYYPAEHLLNIRFNNENRSQYILYADKSADRIAYGNNSLVVFLHIQPTTITCYVNCELVDQEFILDTVYIQSVIDKITRHNDKQFQYNRQSTLLLMNQPIDQIATSFFCLKLDKKNQDLLPDKYALRKFTNALDLLANSLDSPMNNDREPNVSQVEIPVINGYGSLRGQGSSGAAAYDRVCSTDDDCNTKVSSMKCQSGRCICPQRSFWSSSLNRCIQCQDISLGSRCFRLSNHKSTWFESNDYCQDDEGQEYTMKLASNLNRTDLLYLKDKFLHDNDEEHNDYMYWIGATTEFDTRKVQQSRSRRAVPSTTFRWYDNGEIAQLNVHDLWCSPADYSGLSAVNNNQLCVSLTSCGLYADDCQRNYRFLCEAV